MKNLMLLFFLCMLNMANVCSAEEKKTTTSTEEEESTNMVRFNYR